MIRSVLPWVFVAALTAHGGTHGADPAVARVGQDGRVEISCGNATLCELTAGLYDAQWSGAEATAATRPTIEPAARALRLVTAGGVAIQGSANVVARNGAMEARYTFTPDQDVTLNSLHVGADFSIAALAGGTWKADEQSGKFPAEFGEIGLFNGSVRSLTLDLPGGQSLAFRFPKPTSILIQDNRQWGPTFVVRILCSSDSGRVFRKGVQVLLEFTLHTTAELRVEQDAPVTIVAGKEWIPLQLQLDIEPGSALDFSQLHLQDAPAGKHGWLKANSDGTFAFETQPGKSQRFYGVNFCFSAHYISHEQADRLAERLARLGYNTVRLHHYEGELTEGQPDRTQLNPQKLDQLDYLFAALVKRGIYVTTDLYVSRPVNIASILSDFEAGRREAMNSFKVLAVINEKAYENWKSFARNLLTHVNPYTQRAYKDDPGLAWLSLINEGNLGNYLSLIREIPDYHQAWNRWLVAQYRDRAALATAWGAILGEEEDPSRGSVELKGDIYNQDLRARDLVRFLNDVELDFMKRATQFLREEIGTQALVTNMNAWTNHVVSQSVRAEMDYVDDHFYVDHPDFLEQPWRLPSRCPNTSPVAAGASGGRHITFTRLSDRPFSLSEYNYSAPGRYRGVGGILTGSIGALQGWGVIWRFAYSHNRDHLFEPGRLDYFNMVSDPLGQAAERASICLFLRGDMQAAPHSLSIVMTPEDLAQPPARIPQLAPAWHWAAWVTRVGTRVIGDPAHSLSDDLVLPLGWATPESDYTQARVAGLGDPYQLTGEQLLAALRQRGILDSGNPTDPSKNVFQSETGEITIDGPQDILTLDTPRTAGGFAAAGEAIRTTHGVHVLVHDVPATVWVSTLNDEPIAGSRRLLVTHLTDLQNTEIHYGELARQTLLDWGRLPHLMQAGRAEVRLQLADPKTLHVWALSTSGARVTEVPAEVKDGTLVFTADVACAPEHGAIMSYEIAPQ
ncbi:MAG: beta-galactosidase [Pirellulaceae bacterium]